MLFGVPRHVGGLFPDCAFGLRQPLSEPGLQSFEPPADLPVLLGRVADQPSIQMRNSREGRSGPGESEDRQGDRNRSQVRRPQDDCGQSQAGGGNHQ